MSTTCESSTVKMVVAASATAGLLAVSSQQSFVSVAPTQAQRVPTLLRGSAGQENPSNLSLGTVAGSAALAMGAVAAATSRRQATVCRAAAVKKKGVRVVEGKEIPWNLFGPKAPYKGECLIKDTVTDRTPLPNWETCHVVMKHDGNMPYIEGQSIGVIAPGPDKKGESPAKLRLYSIASSAPGDDETGKTVSLIVKRVLEVEGMGWCNHSNVEPGTDKEYPDAKMVYRGVCSSHICDLKVGDDVLLTGPTGAEMLLPEDPESNVIMMATGTGIAPFRSHLRHLFHDKVSKGKFKGLAWMFLGVPYAASLLYDEEWKEMQAANPDQFRYDYAISNEEKCDINKINGEMWVQHKMMMFKEELWALVKDPKTHIYMCGLKGMESGFAECFQDLAEKEGLVWTEFTKSLKKGKRYHVEVY
eukprot:CAMPEP_0197653574 /NCGR_PEP_ID=MMETSP1338-20131121/36178_1 /TAXON_ID=43686 ORGANISM="Pelagodinium beii, Strain RCC1491" /NCGR_SAMPLE_ID=MMETSP1338 /ASSEMBLY_ACC=CAM_ASM_000754 /LENGTH=416 /DNA_ID=CAMNT_0043228739 /DNA_START=61 /DNA_END=1311 /DNA_ORIENTATION=-